MQYFLLISLTLYRVNWLASENLQIITETNVPSIYGASLLLALWKAVSISVTCWHLIYTWCQCENNMRKYSWQHLAAYLAYSNHLWSACCFAVLAKKRISRPEQHWYLHGRAVLPRGQHGKLSTELSIRTTQLSLSSMKHSMLTTNCMDSAGWAPHGTRCVPSQHATAKMVGPIQVGLPPKA